MVFGGRPLFPLQASLSSGFVLESPCGLNLPLPPGGVCAFRSNSYVIFLNINKTLKEMGDYMLFPQIRLQSTFAQTELQIQKPVQQIEQPRAELSIEQPKAELTIERTPGRLTIDQTQAREDMDLKSVGRRIEEAAQLGRQDWLAGIARVAQDGNEMMRIEDGGGAIARQAKRNSEGPPKEFNIGWIPSHFSVKINYEPGSVDIQVQERKPVIDAKVNKPVHEYTPGSTQVSLANHSSLQIDFENLRYVGTAGYEQKI